MSTRLIDMNGNSAMAFSREAVEAVGSDWRTVEQFNELLADLRIKRRAEVAREGELARSRLAWKVVVFQQAMLYRVVMLADGCAAMWNSRNILGSVLCARALTESAAVLWDFESQVAHLASVGDLAAIDRLVINKTFSTKLKEWYENEEGTEAINVLTIMRKLDVHLDGTMTHYLRLSEICHPNSWGHFLMFGNMEGNTVRLSESKSYVRGLFSHLFGAFVLIGLVERSLEAIDRSLPKIIELEAHR